MADEFKNSKITVSNVFNLSVRLQQLTAVKTRRQQALFFANNWLPVLFKHPTETVLLLLNWF